MSIVRVDVSAFLAKALNVPNASWAMYAVPVVVLLVTGWLVWRETRRTQNLAPDSVATFLVLVGSLVGIYHLVYDVILLTLPAAALFTGVHSSWRDIPRSGRMVLKAGAIILALNVFWTGPGVRVAKTLASYWPELLLPWSDRCWQAALLVNPTTLVAMWVLAVVLCVRTAQGAQRALAAGS